MFTMKWMYNVSQQDETPFDTWWFSFLVCWQLCQLLLCQTHNKAQWVTCWAVSTILTALGTQFYCHRMGSLNPLTPNGLYRGHAVSLLNSRMATIVATNSVSKFGGILFTPIRLFAVVCYAPVPLTFRLSYSRQIVPPPPPTPIHKHRYIRRCIVTAHFQ